MSTSKEGTVSNVNAWLLRRSINGRASEEKFDTEGGLRAVLDPIAWQGLVGFEVTTPDGRLLKGIALEDWYIARHR